MTNTLRTLLLGAGLALLSSAAFAAPAVTIAEAGFATGPGADYDTTGKLAIGTHVDVVWCGTHASWCLINLHNKMGWVPLASLTFSLAHKGDASAGGGDGNGDTAGPGGPVGTPVQDVVMNTNDGVKRVPPGSNLLGKLSPSGITMVLKH